MKKGQMNPEHKEALAVGRSQSKIVRDYLESLNKPEGRKVSTDALHERLEKIDQTLATNLDPVKRVMLTQHRFDLLEAIGRAGNGTDNGQLEKEFIAIAAEYADRKRISYQAFREVGVPAAVLRAAGIKRAAVAA